MDRISPGALEARTRQIGREIFARARAAEPTILHPRWWPQQLLNLATREERAKNRLFQFIDVLPMLRTSREVAEHLQEYLGDPGLGLPGLMRAGVVLGRPGSPLRPLTCQVIRWSALRMARMFICGETAEEAIRAVRRLRRRRMAFTLDILGEACTSERQADEYASRYLDLMDALSGAMAGEGEVEQIDIGPAGPLPRVNLSLKLSSLAARFDPVDAAGTLERVAGRLRPILRRARECGAFVNFDIEQYGVLRLSLEIIRRLLSEEEFRDWADVGTVVQAYLRESESVAREMLEWVRRRGAPITVRLVKGAYWEYEVFSALKSGGRIPVYTSKWESDASFERLARFLIDHHRWLRPALASHNVRSLAAGMAYAEAKGLGLSDLEVQMLYGMGDPLKRAIVAMGYRLRVYAPYGDLIPGMAYLIRRLLENTSNEGFLHASFAEGRSEEELLEDPVRAGRRAGPARLPRPRITNWFDDEEPAMPAFVNTARTDFSDPENVARMEEAIEAVRRAGERAVPLVIDGEAVVSGAWFESVNPAHPAERLARVAAARHEDVARAVAGAEAALESWSGRGWESRIAVFERAAEIVSRRRFELCAWTVLEAGKPWLEADLDVAETIDCCRYYAQQLRRLCGRPTRRDYPGESNEYRYVPRGVVAVITSGQFPLPMFGGLCAAALLAGNTVVAKPASATAGTASLLVDILREAGVPPGALQFLPGAGAEVGRALVESSGVGMVAFVGSTSVGREVYGWAAQPRPEQRHLKHMIAGLGGNNPIVVDADADLDEAVTGVLYSAFSYAGQKCSSCQRAIVVEAVYEQFLKRLVESAESLPVGDPAAPGTFVGPMLTKQAYERVRGYIEMGRKEAERVVQSDIGGLAGEGWYVPPTILAGVGPEALVAREEIGGPVVVVMRARDFEEAVAVANGTAYALTAGVYSRRPSHIERAREGLRCGNLYINRPITGALIDRQPFGGYGLSGLSCKIGGPDFLLEFVQPRTITENTIRHGLAGEETVVPARHGEE